MAKMNKIIMLFLVILVALSPSFAQTIHPAVTTAFFNDRTANSGIISYMDLGTGHAGSWSISGYFMAQDGGHDYYGSGTVLPVFSRYWGPRMNAPYITSYNMKGTANI